MLVHKKEDKEQDTPASAFILRYSACRASIETRPDKPHKTWLVAELKQPMAEDSRQPCVARRGRWGPRTPRERNHSWWLSAKLKNYASVKFSLKVVWREKSHSITLSSGDKIRVEGATVRIPQQLTFCVSCKVEFRDRLILLSNAREPSGRDGWVPSSLVTF